MFHKRWNNIDFNLNGGRVQQSENSITYLLKEETRRRILQYVLASRSGINHGILSKKVGIDRKNLRPYVKQLQEENLIVRGKDNKYYIRESSLGTNYLATQIFSNNFIESVLESDELLFEDVMRFDSKFLFTKYQDNGLERALFEFSNKVGGLITYLIIQSLYPGKKGEKKLHSHGQLYDFFLSNRWIRNYLEMILPSLPFIFKEKVRDHLHFGDDRDDNLDNFYLRILDYSYKVPLLQVDKKFVDEMLVSFTKLYPTFSSQIKRIAERLPKDISDEMNHSAYIKAKIETERKCSHDYKKNPPGIFEFEGRKTKITHWGVKHCSRCHHTIYPK
jgi:hypothetical protein